MKRLKMMKIPIQVNLKEEIKNLSTQKNSMKVITTRPCCKLPRTAEMQKRLRYDLNNSKAYQLQKLNKYYDYICDNRGLLHLFQILLDSGADPNRMYLLTRVAPIHVASRKGYCAILDLLLNYGADVNAVSSDGKTCLHVLASKCVSTSGDKNFLQCLSRVLNAKGIQVSHYSRN